MKLAQALAAPFLLARRQTPRAECVDPHILVIRRNRMGDMICTLPLLHALRRQYPAARITVACDAPGLPIAQACSAVDSVLLLRSGWSRWLSLARDAARLQGFDWVIAVKAGFDQRLAWLARATHAAWRIGYEDREPSNFYTHPVPIPSDLWRIHQIEATLGLLRPLGVPAPADPLPALRLDLPPASLAFVQELDPWLHGRRLALINISSTTAIRFRDQDFRSLIRELVRDTNLAIGVVALPEDRESARKLVAESCSQREDIRASTETGERPGHSVRVLETPGPLELAAVLGRAAFLVTGEGGAAHLAAAMGTPALVLWSEGPFEKWHSRGANHTFVRLERGESSIPLEHVLAALPSLLR